MKKAVGPGTSTYNFKGKRASQAGLTNRIELLPVRWTRGLG